MKKRTSLDSYSILLIVWLIIFLLIIRNNHPSFVKAVWLIIVPYSVLIVLVNYYYLIPFSPEKKFWNRHYLLGLLPITLTIDFVASIIFKTAVPSVLFLEIFIYIFIYTIFIPVPLSWYLYRNSSEKRSLQKELGSSQANLKLLQSQINPHFLFNTLNSLYGTALQENAERTSEGIQKLGDMMRFMLYENTQNTIPLIKEVDYLKNYIDLQKLRIANSPENMIETEIANTFNNLQIAPMILIPFVENAFKHGISLNEPSFIKIILQTSENRLFFTVNNSIHAKAKNDPEKKTGGIGLENVKQRLALLYSGKYDLTTHQTQKEYFVILGLTL